MIQEGTYFQGGHQVVSDLAGKRMLHQFPVAELGRNMGMEMYLINALLQAVAQQVLKMMDLRYQLGFIAFLPECMNGSFYQHGLTLGGGQQKGGRVRPPALGGDP